MVAMILAMLLLVAPVWAAEYNWSKVRMGGKEVNNTLAAGTNDASWIVGYWETRDEIPESQAFRFQKNKFTPFTIPGAPDAVNIFPEDIGASSTIVGTYRLPVLDARGWWTLHAFLYRHGLNDHIIIDVPGAVWTFAFAVNDKRQVALGYFTEPETETDKNWGAAIYDYATNTFTPVTVFGHEVVTITGINNHGDLTGHVEVVVDDPQCGCRDIVHFAFARIAGQDHVLVPPEWARAVFPDAINDNGVIVGSAELHNHSETGEMVGFRADLTAGAWAMIRHPNLQDGWSLWLTDIDNKGRMTAIVGRHVDSYYESWWLRPR